MIDAKFNVFRAHGFFVDRPEWTFKPWMQQAHDSIAAQVAAEDTTNFTANTSLVVSNGVATVGGTAPVDVRSIFIAAWSGPSSGRA